MISSGCNVTAVVVAGGGSCSSSPYVVAAVDQLLEHSTVMQKIHVFPFMVQGLSLLTYTQTRYNLVATLPKLSHMSICKSLF